MNIEIASIIIGCVVVYFLGSSYISELLLEEARFLSPDETAPKKWLWFLSASENIGFGYLSIYFISVLSIYLFSGTNTYTFLFLQATFSVLFLLSYVDIKTKIIPDASHIFLICIGLVWSPEITGISTSSLIFGMVGGYLLMYICMWVTSVIIQKEAMGVGDIKLVASLGSFIGLYQVPSLLLISSVLAVVFFAFFKDREKPFGQYLSLGGFFIILYNTLGFGLVGI